MATYTIHKCVIKTFAISVLQAIELVLFAEICVGGGHLLNYMKFIWNLSSKNSQCNNI